MELLGCAPAPLGLILGIFLAQGWLNAHFAVLALRLGVVACVLVLLHNLLHLIVQEPLPSRIGILQVPLAALHVLFSLVALSLVESEGLGCGDLVFRIERRSEPVLAYKTGSYQFFHVLTIQTLQPLTLPRNFLGGGSVGRDLLEPGSVMRVLLALVVANK